MAAGAPRNLDEPRRAYRKRKQDRRVFDLTLAGEHWLKLKGDLGVRYCSFANLSAMRSTGDACVKCAMYSPLRSMR
jgi:hypothetical protein